MLYLAVGAVVTVGEVSAARDVVEVAVITRPA